MRLSLTAVAIAALTLLSVGIVSAQTPVDPSEVMPTATMDSDTTSLSTCIVNGEQVPCEELAGAVGAAAPYLIGFMILMVIIGLACTVFWVWMLVHAVTHPVENKPLWILILVLTGILGAIIYFFAVKRQFDRGGTIISPPTAVPPVQL